MAWNNGWNNNNNYRGGNRNWDRDYDRRGGYDRPPYDDRRGRNYGYDEPVNNFKFSVGQKCFLKDFPDTVVSVIRTGREQYECRLPDLNTQWFYEHELEAVETK